jgi:hypothetical protein
MKHINIITIFLLWPALAWSEVIPRQDYIRCKREKETTRQFCEVKNEPIHLKTILSHDVNSTNVEIEILDPLAELQIELLMPDQSTNKILLPSLAPQIKFDLLWTDVPECTRNRLWSEDRIYLEANDSDEFLPFMERLRPGTSYHELNLSNLHSSTFAPWQINRIDNNIEISSTIRLKNNSQTPEVPLPPERIPVSCKMEIYNFYLGFDSQQMIVDVTNLETTASLIDQSLVKSYVLHGLYQGQQHGTLCSIFHLGSTLRTVEVLLEDDLWDDLSRRAQKALASGVEKAVEQGVIDSSKIKIKGEELDYWGYFKADDFQTRLTIACESTSSDDYIVSPEPFIGGDGEIINQVGHKNALDYARQKSNLYKVLQAAWAIKSVADFETNVSLELDWLLDPYLDSYFE